MSITGDNSNMGSASSSQKTVERRRLADLRPHPLQATYFPADPADSIERFAETLRRGLDHPVEITPDGVIICGHRRTAAAKHLGWIEIDCWVRHDLASQGPGAIEERFLEDNLERRQLGKLAIARCYLRLRTIADEKGRAGRRDNHSQSGDIRDVIGERLGLSGRTLDRLLNVLRAPKSVQDAFERDELPLVMAERVARLPAAVQAEIASELAAGRRAQDVVGEKLQEDVERRASYGLDRSGLFKRWQRCIGHLRQDIPFLQDHVADLPKPSPAAREVIDSAITFLLQLKTRHSEAISTADSGSCGSAQPGASGVAIPAN